MNKKLIATAVASAMAAPMAASADSSLTTYGTVGAAVESVDNGVDDALGVNSNHSAFGFDGSFDLNNDTAAVFHYDAFVDIDAGGGNGDNSLIHGGRDGWVGLRGSSFGTVALGFQGRPWKTLSHALDPFEGTIADYSSIMGNSGNGGEYFDGGIGNAIIWFGPNINGFTWHAQYGAEETEDGANNIGLQANYSNDMYFIGASFDRNEDAADVGDDTTVLKIVGSVNLDVATITGAYETMDGIGFASDDADRDAYWIAGTLPVGMGSLRAAYAKADDVDGVSSSGADQVSIGYFGDFNIEVADSAQWYVIYSSISNDSNANYGFTSAPHTSSFDSSLGGQTGEDSDAFAAGIKINYSANLL